STTPVPSPSSTPPTTKTTATSPSKASNPPSPSLPPPTPEESSNSSKTAAPASSSPQTRRAISPPASISSTVIEREHNRWASAGGKEWRRSDGMGWWSDCWARSVAMKIAVSGAHRTGKTTLVEELCRALPAYIAVDEPYHLLEEEGHEFAEMPSLEDFELLLERS